MKTEEAIKFLEEQGYTITKELIEIKELNIKITKPKEYTKSYEELLKEIPKGFRLIKCSEIFKLEELGLLRDIINNCWIPCEQLPIDKENNHSRWLCLDDSDLSSDWDGLGSNGGGRVIFVEEK